MKKHYLIEGFHERKDQVLYEWVESGRKIKEIADAMGIARNHVYDRVNWSSGKLAKFCAVTGESADWLLGLKKERR